MKKKGETPISTEKGKALAQETGARSYFEISALTQEGLKDVFDSAARIVVNKFKKEEGGDQSTSTNSTDTKCCSLL